MIDVDSMYNSILELHKQLVMKRGDIKPHVPKDKEMLIHALEKIKGTQQKILSVLPEVLSRDKLVTLSQANRLIDECEYIVTCIFKNLEIFDPFHIDQIGSEYQEFVITTIQTKYCTFVYRRPHKKFQITIYEDEAEANKQGDIRKQVHYNVKTGFLDSSLDYQYSYLIN